MCAGITKNQPFPPIPNLFYEGIAYSSINIPPDSDLNPLQTALGLFVPRSHNTTEDKQYLKACLTLYQAMSFACMSIGDQDATNYRLALKAYNSWMIVFRPAALLSLLLARLNRDLNKVKEHLNQILINCIFCVPSDKYQVILLAATAGVDPDSYIASVEYLGCTNLKECMEKDIKVQTDMKKIQLDLKSHSNKLFEIPTSKLFLLLYGLWILVHFF
ncbi:hypothetical protein CROQUDRAFT_41899 [Cronartium quercuum f. sp. fusiforme G11]|uniref:DUF7143 domain-containing protein n=1 Tax=Cronartium quercuum f. sp. fusiforme G11 TaxID=708437 RepID=A0A9P6NJH3_9BASI|nr:hypothetical protein CROQUDRAFT_41899 [Cronartium quercuum f. sp. fusiforme G11]